MQTKHSKDKNAAKRIRIANLAKWVFPALSLLMLLALATSSAFLWLRAKNKCVTNKIALNQAKPWFSRPAVCEMIGFLHLRAGCILR